MLAKISANDIIELTTSGNKRNRSWKSNESSHESHDANLFDDLGPPPEAPSLAKRLGQQESVGHVAPYKSPYIIEDLTVVRFENIRLNETNNDYSA